MEEQKKQPWEDYVVLSRHITGRERELIEEALNKIVAAPDGEGIELLQKAFIRNNSQRLPITAIEMGSSADVNRQENPTGYFVNIDIKSIANLSFGKNEAARPVSVMGMLVHELYHVADDKSHFVQTTLVRLALVQSGVGLEPLSTELAAKIREEAAQVMSDIRKNQHFSVDHEAPYDPKRYPNIAAFVRRLKTEIDDSGYPNAHSEVLRMIGAVVHGADKHENDATRYTDAFMQKSGCNEPWRGQYYNTQRRADKTKDDAHNPTCAGLAPTQGYEAPAVSYESLGQLGAPLNVPIVRPHQPHNAAPTRFK